MIPDLCAPVDEVAPRLLGAVLRHGPVAVRLTELEAYDAATDPASHAYRGQYRAECGHVRAARPPIPVFHLRHALGRKYQLRTRRGRIGSLDACRRGDRGTELARSRRGQIRDRDLARGPGRLTQALGLASEHKGCDLFGNGPVTLHAAGGTQS